MTVTPRRRSSRAWLSDPLAASGWLVVLVVLVTLAGALGGWFAILALVAATTFGVVAFVLLTTDPRPAIAVALVAADIAIGKIGSGPPALDITLSFFTSGRAGGARSHDRSQPRHVYSAGK